MVSTAVPTRVTTSRFAPLVATAAGVGVLNAALAVVQLAAPAQPADGHHFARASDYVIEVLFAVSLFAAAGTVLLVARYHAQLGRWGRLGAVAAGAYAVGTALFGLSSAATAARGTETLDVVQLPAIGLWLVGGVLLAIVTFRARVLPAVVCVGFAVALPASIALGHAGPFALAALWLAVAGVARRNRRRVSSAERSSAGR